jgi:hypothetical protein
MARVAGEAASRLARGACIALAILATTALAQSGPSNRAKGAKAAADSDRQWLQCGDFEVHKDGQVTRLQPAKYWTFVLNLPARLVSRYLEDSRSLSAAAPLEVSEDRLRWMYVDMTQSVSHTRESTRALSVNRRTLTLTEDTLDRVSMKAGATASAASRTIGQCKLIAPQALAQKRR